MEFRSANPHLTPHQPHVGVVGHTTDRCLISQSSVHSKWRFFYHLFPTGLLRYASPRDGQTLLHRAAEGCLPDNVTLLLHTDEELANIQDNYGNTALQIACTKAHKPTVKARKLLCPTYFLQVVSILVPEYSHEHKCVPTLCYNITSINYHRQKPLHIQYRALLGTYNKIHTTNKTSQL